MENSLKKELTACEKEEAVQVIENEIGDVRMALILLDEKLRNTCLFNDLHLLEIIDNEIGKIPCDSQGQYAEEVLLSAHQFYCSFRVRENSGIVDN